MNQFVIPEQLPGANDYINLCRRNMYQANEMKHETELLITRAINRALRAKECKFTDKPVDVYITWGERTKRRDVDNIQFAQKFILDAMKGKLIPNDGQKYVRQVFHRIEHTEGTVVRIEEHPAG